MTATSPTKIRLPGVPIIHIGSSDAFYSVRPNSLSGLRASLILVLIWIKSCARNLSPSPAPWLIGSGRALAVGWGQFRRRRGLDGWHHHPPHRQERMPCRISCDRQASRLRRPSKAT
jgi:hypothetical protein